MIYRTLQGDTWDGIAFKLYGDAKLMTLLINANPDHAQTVIFSAGVQLKAPDRPAETADDLPPWRREG
ncbi:tail protein X [Cohnella nanjingensis]|uniref:Tail protein X n=1 Tax=Cohnella nanjingensis TaxID=1387779 RepID=A0A7X0VE02_9BACL|nr:tail protein X [Cohnella nanjingensis]MBB6670507.1 tail protein X [Cohnella nanjingensis]